MAQQHVTITSGHLKGAVLTFIDKGDSIRVECDNDFCTALRVRPLKSRGATVFNDGEKRVPNRPDKWVAEELQWNSETHRWNATGAICFGRSAELAYRTAADIAF